MPGLNLVQLIGNLGRDPEGRYTPSGTRICTFSLAVNRRWTGSDGQPKEATDWFNVEAWGRLGEICQEYLVKGSLVYISGRLQTDRYEHEGESRFFTKVIAQKMQMLDRKDEQAEPALEVEEAG
jgi:single-strand DNA-binding protein